MRMHANAGEMTGLEETARFHGACDVSQVEWVTQKDHADTVTDSEVL